MMKFADLLHQTANTGFATLLVLGRPFTILKQIGDGANSIVYQCLNSAHVEGVSLTLTATSSGKSERNLFNKKAHIFSAVGLFSNVSFK